MPQIALTNLLKFDYELVDSINVFLATTKYQKLF